MPSPAVLCALALLALGLAACPEERPGAVRHIPAQRLPPAVSIEAAPADGGSVAPAAPDGGGAEGGTARAP